MSRRHRTDGTGARCPTLHTRAARTTSPVQDLTLSNFPLNLRKCALPLLSSQLFLFLQQRRRKDACCAQAAEDCARGESLGRYVLITCGISNHRPCHLCPPLCQQEEANITDQSDSRTHEADGMPNRQIFAHGAVRGRALCRQLLPHHREHVQQDHKVQRAGLCNGDHRHGRTGLCYLLSDTYFFSRAPSSLGQRECPACAE